MTILTSIIVLGVIGLAAAALLYLAATKFRVEEDPRIAEVEELLPGANCGGCGLTGCHAFAMACCQATSLQGLNCTGLDAEGMKRIASIVGLDAVAAQKRIAVIRCSASCETRDPLNYYDGVRSCAIESAFYQGETDCIYGCLANGDCAAACPFGAMTIKEGDALPTVDPDKCTGCGKCVEACPRNLVELVPVEEGKSLVWVACANRDRGPVAMKECGVACIGCTKCAKVCPSGAPSIASFLAHIDQDKCTGCGTCVEACPRHTIKTDIPLHRQTLRQA